METGRQNLIPVDKLKEFAKTCEAIGKLAEGPVKLKFDASGKGAAMCLSWDGKEIYFSEEWKDEHEESAEQRKRPATAGTVTSQEK